MSCTENLIDLTIILYYMYAALPRNSQTGWLYSSVSWPNRNPAVPFSHWFLTPDVLPPPPQKAELPPTTTPPPSQKHTGLAGLHLRGGNWRVTSHEFSHCTYQLPDKAHNNAEAVSPTGKLANFTRNSAPKRLK